MAVRQGAVLPDILARSQVLYAPARILPSTVDRLHERQHGHWIALLPSEVGELHKHAMTAASAATTVHQESLRAAARPVDPQRKMTHDDATPQDRQRTTAAALPPSIL